MGWTYECVTLPISIIVHWNASNTEERLNNQVDRIILLVDVGQLLSSATSVLMQWAQNRVEMVVGMETTWPRYMESYSPWLILLLLNVESIRSRDQW